jgi:hypothetical protein
MASADHDRRTASADYESSTWRHQRLGREEVGLALARAYHGFQRHRGLDSAAALAFFSALAVFPASLCVVSVVALLDDRTNAPGGPNRQYRLRGARGAAVVSARDNRVRQREARRRTNSTAK